jgi:hypothetical protein
VSKAAQPRQGAKLVGNTVTLQSCTSIVLSAINNVPMSLTTTRKRHHIVPLVVIGLILVVVVWFALEEYRDARWYAIHSYVASVCQAVDRFQKENGHFPQSLSQIDKSTLDYDLHIPLQELDYQLTETGYRVSYQPKIGRVVSCP